MKKTILVLFVSLCAVVAGAQDYEISVSEPQHDAFMGTTVNQITIQYNDTEFAFAMFFYTQRTTKTEKLAWFGLALSGEWECQHFYLKLEDGTIQELFILKQDIDYIPTAVTSSSMLVDEETVHRMLKSQGNIQARMVYKSPLYVEIYNFDFVIPEQFLDEMRNTVQEGSE